MKTDNYLTLCLEQATKSPLHYRHGCIIVRGGKVIGEGYNDYRHGFEGPTLKHGHITKGAFDGQAIAELKAKLKKRKQKPQQGQQPQSGTTATTKPFVPFEGIGGGKHANTPLSMHSEMMAIHSALAACSKVSCTAFSREKPCFKLSRDDKRKARLRREVLKAYVDAVCSEASSASADRAGFKSAVLKPPHLNQVSRDHAGTHSAFHQRNQNNKERKGEREEREDKESLARRCLLETQLAFQERLRSEKHHQKKNEKDLNEKKGDRYGYQYRRYGQQTQQGHPERHVHKRQKDEDDSLDQDNGSKLDHVVRLPSRSHPQAKHRKEGQRVNSASISTRVITNVTEPGKTKTSQAPPQPQPLLMPNGHTGHSSRDESARKKHSRLVGADLYVSRLGWNRGGPRKAAQEPRPPPSVMLEPSENELVTSDMASMTSSTASLPSTTSTTSTGSLHDELINRDPSPRPRKLADSVQAFDTDSVHASRPCYRCITYMQAVGIKRVFWTNDAGAWEGGKVRDLVDALDSSMTSGPDGGPLGNGVFVTKHEVLMLKRIMGQEKGS